MDLHSDHVSRSHAREQLRAFSQALFQPQDTVEIRAIQPSDAAGSKRLLHRRWLPAGELAVAYDALCALNAAGAHLFFGVNPRCRQGGAKDCVALARAVWADFDEPDRQQVQARMLGVLPEPSLLVASGRGYHAYWLLAEPVMLNTTAARDDFESVLRRLYAALGSDATQDVSRLLRLPGFLNPKAPRPAPCRLLACDATRRYDWEVFRPWRHGEEACEEPGPLAGSSLPAAQDARRIRGLIDYLDRPVADRSRRDFGVLCGLLRLDPRLSNSTLWQLVGGRSKFSDDRAGRRYFELTANKARRAIGR